MKTLSLPQTGLSASNIVLGLMRIKDLSDDQIRTLVKTALDEGITMFDNADGYGGAPHVCEARFGEVVNFSPAEREKVVIQTKTGIRDGYFDFSKEHIVESAEGSLKAMKLDYIDVLLLHRPDTLVEPDEVAAAFDELHSAGKVRSFGVSNHTPGQIELLKRSVKQPLVFNQVQLSITHAPLIAQGIAMNMQQLPQSVSRDNGLLDYARLNGITLQAWSPFQKQWFDGTFLGDRAELSRVERRHRRAERKVRPDRYRHRRRAGSPATRRTSRSLWAAPRPSASSRRRPEASSPLTREEWYRIFTAAGYTLP